MGLSISLGKMTVGMRLWKMVEGMISTFRTVYFIFLDSSVALGHLDYIPSRRCDEDSSTEPDPRTLELSRFKHNNPGQDIVLKHLH